MLKEAMTVLIAKMPEAASTSRPCTTLGKKAFLSCTSFHVSKLSNRTTSPTADCWTMTVVTSVHFATHVFYA